MTYQNSRVLFRGKTQLGGGRSAPLTLCPGAHPGGSGAAGLTEDLRAAGVGLGLPVCEMRGLGVWSPARGPPSPRAPGRFSEHTRCGSSPCPELPSSRSPSSRPVPPGAPRRDIPAAPAPGGGAHQSGNSTSSSASLSKLACFLGALGKTRQRRPDDSTGGKSVSLVHLLDIIHFKKLV